MSYTPTTWAAGDTVTAAKLNKLEQGVASSGGVLVVGATRSGNKIICDKTCKEMWDAMKTGGVLVDGTTFCWTIVYSTNTDDNGYTFVTFDNLTFFGENDNDNPWASAMG